MTYRCLAHTARAHLEGEVVTAPASRCLAHSARALLEGEVATPTPPRKSLSHTVRAFMEGTLHEAEDVGEKGVIASTTNDDAGAGPPQAQPQAKDKKKKAQVSDPDDPKALNFGIGNPVDLAPMTDDPRTQDNKDRKDNKVVEAKKYTTSKDLDSFRNKLQQVRNNKTDEKLVQHLDQQIDKVDKNLEKRLTRSKNRLARIRNEAEDIEEAEKKTLPKGIHLGNYHRNIRSRVMKIMSTNQNLINKHGIIPPEPKKEETELDEAGFDPFVAAGHIIQTAIIGHHRGHRYYRGAKKKPPAPPPEKHPNDDKPLPPIPTMKTTSNKGKTGFKASDALARYKEKQRRGLVPKQSLFLPDGTYRKIKWDELVQ